MARMPAVPSDVFLDTSHLVALASTRDEYHQKAVELAEATAAAGTRIVSTEAVILEVGNSLAQASSPPWCSSPPPLDPGGQYRRYRAYDNGIVASWPGSL